MRQCPKLRRRAIGRDGKFRAILTADATDAQLANGLRKLFEALTHTNAATAW